MYYNICCSIYSSIVVRVSYRIFGLGGEIYWCINEARKCEGVGGIFSNSWGGGGGGGKLNLGGGEIPGSPPSV